MNSELTFYEILWRLVRAWPETKVRHERLNGFAILESIASMESPSFGKDYRHYSGRTYYSREWEQGGLAADANAIEFPALALYEFDFSARGFSRVSRVQGLHQFEVYLLAPMPEPVPNGVDYDREQFYTFEEMSSILKGMATSLMAELESFVRVTHLSTAGVSSSDFGSDFGPDFSSLDPDDTLASYLGWQSQKWMDQLVSQNSIAGYQYDLNLNSYIDTREISGPVTPYMLSDGLMGYSFRLQVASDVCRTVSGFDYD